jgi:hypothetical protein
MLTEMLRQDGINADYVDLSGVDTWGIKSSAMASAITKVRTVSGPLRRLIHLPFTVRESFAGASDAEFRPAVDGALNRILQSPRPVLVAWYVDNRDDYLAVKQMSACLRTYASDIHQTLVGSYLERYGASVLQNFKSMDTGITDDIFSALATLSRNLDMPESWGRIPGLVFRTRSGITCAPRNIHPVKNMPPRDFGVRVKPGTASDRQKQFPLYALNFTCTANDQYGTRPGAIRPLQKSVTHLLDEIRFFNGRYGAGVFHIDAAHVSAATLERFADTLLGDDFMAIYSLGNVTEPFSDKTADRLFASGCRAAGFRIPTGSQRLLEDFYGFDMSISAMRATVRRCRAAGIFTVAHLCYPSPWDDYHTRAETELFLEACRPDGIEINTPELMPHSIWFTRAHAYGFIFDHHNFQQWVECSGSQQDDMPYQMQHWKRGRAAEAKHSLATHAESLGCTIGITEKHGLLARIARSTMEEASFLGALKEGLVNNDAAKLGGLIKCVCSTIDLLHNDAVPLAKKAKAL